MGTQSKLLLRILDGRSDANIEFSDLRSLLLHLGFEERTRGSHHIFRRLDVEERLTLQRQGSKAKPYQVRQVRAVILRYRLGERIDV
jgi:predicted RNA binding protein YcfA (HicA-like mRNA interferase family)